MKLTVKIHPCHNGVIPIKMSKPIIQEQLAYFLTDNNTDKGRNISIKMLNYPHHCSDIHQQTHNILKRRVHWTI